MILSPTNEPIDEYWIREFCGLFWGEGCLSLGKVTRIKRHQIFEYGPFYRPQAIIVTRKDDSPMLLEIQSKLGGTVNKKPVWSKDNPNRSPVMRWFSAKKEDNLRVAAALSLGRLPAKKALELPCWIEAIHLQGGAGHKHSPETKERLDFLYQELHRMKAFKVL